MATRTTIMLDDDIVKKIRTKQAKTIQETQQACSFGKIINDILREVL